MTSVTIETLSYQNYPWRNKTLKEQGLCPLPMSKTFLQRNIISWLWFKICYSKIMFCYVCTNLQCMPGFWTKKGAPKKVHWFWRKHSLPLLIQCAKNVCIVEFLDLGVFCGKTSVQKHCYKSISKIDICRAIAIVHWLMNFEILVNVGNVC